MIELIVDKGTVSRYNRLEVVPPAYMQNMNF